MSAVSLETGKVSFFDQNNTSYDEFYKAAFSSTCIPGLFPAYHWYRDGQDNMFSDNYMIQNINPYSAIKQCLELVDDPSKITVDVLMLGSMKEFEIKENHEHKSSWFGFSSTDEHDKSIANFMRARDISYLHNNSNSIMQMMRGHPTVNWRYILQQEDAYSGID